jgi:hypothetical protein
MRFPWANLLLLGLIVLQVGTGVAGLLAGGDGFRAVFWLHIVGAYAIFVLMFAKTLIVTDAIRRRPRVTQTPGGLVVLVAMLLFVLASGFVWSAGGSRSIGGVSLINLHAYVAVGLAILLAWHVSDRRWIARVPGAAGRGALLRSGGVILGGVILWRVERLLQPALGLPGADRRWTGSYETGSLTGEFPETSWLDDDPDPVDVSSWRLIVDGAVTKRLELDIDQLRGERRATVEAVLDCTGGWYTRQRWGGVALGDLLDRCGLAAGADSVRVTSVTGYGRRFSIERARGLLLAFEVTGEGLAHGHGRPLRLVVPNRRGYEWVKWVMRIEVLRSSHLLQPPLPLT